MRLLLNKVADPSYTAKDVSESIHIAVQQGHTATFSVFLEQNLCKAQSLHGAWALLQRAAFANQGSIVRLLCQHDFHGQKHDFEVSNVKVAL